MYEIVYRNNFSNYEYTRVVNEGKEFIYLVEEIINSKFLTLLLIRRI